MSSKLQLDVRHLNRWWRHLVNAYEVKQAWCVLQVKLCDPCLSALKWFVYHARRYTSARLYFYFLLYFALVDLSEFLCLWYHARFHVVGVCIFIVFLRTIVSANSFSLSVLQNIRFERLCLQLLHCCTAVFCRAVFARFSLGGTERL